MARKLIFRCENCCKVLQSNAKKDLKNGKCPRCEEEFVFPHPVSQEGRKHKRAVVGESKFVQLVPEAHTQSKVTPAYRVMYTEVPPVEFTFRRSSHIPLLDLSEGGMGLLVRVDETSEKLVPGYIFVAEIDFPILIQTIFTQVEVCWVRPLKDHRLRHVGVQFCTSDKSFKGVIKNLIKYIMSRSDTLDFDKWGSFG